MLLHISNDTSIYQIYLSLPLVVVVVLVSIARQNHATTTPTAHYRLSPIVYTIHIFIIAIDIDIQGSLSHPHTHMDASQRHIRDVLSHKMSRIFFASYLARRSRSIFLELWQVIEDYRSLSPKDSTTLRERAQAIIDQFLTHPDLLSTLALPQASLLQIDRARALILVSSINPNMFDDLQSLCLARLAAEMQQYMQLAVFRPGTPASLLFILS